MKITTDVAIVGGGIIGSAIAYYLSKAGADVIVLDQDEIGAEASSAAAGLLAPLGSISGAGPFADLLLAGWSMFPSLVPELEQISEIEVEYEQTGALRVVRNPKNVSNLRKRMQSWEPLGLEMYWLTGEEARQREPLVASDVSAAIYAPQEGQIRASQLTKAFAMAAQKQGAKFYNHKEVNGTAYNNAKVSAIHTSQGDVVTCNQLVIATGAWSHHWNAWLNIVLPVVPQRGQSLTLQQPEIPLRHIIFGEAIYLAPKQDGTIVLAATKEDVGFDKRVTAGGINWLLSTAMRLAPELEQGAIEKMWAGLRPKTPDNMPILGKVPQWENVALSVGHGSTGIMLSSITGQCIAKLVMTGKEDELIYPFSMGRFLKV